MNGTQWCDRKMFNENKTTIYNNNNNNGQKYKVYFDVVAVAIRGGGCWSPMPTTLAQVLTEFDVLTLQQFPLCVLLLFRLHSGFVPFHFEHKGRFVIVMSILYVL